MSGFGRKATGLPERNGNGARGILSRRSTDIEAGQSAGRKGIFRDLRVAAVVRDYGMSERREQAPADNRAIYDVSV